MPGIPALDHKVVESAVADLLMGKPVPERETTILTKDGRIVDVTIAQSVCRDSTGDPTDILGIIRDITGKRRIEKQLHHAQKMEALGTLAGGIAHDFNNLLMVISGHTEMAMSHLSEDSPARKNLDQILSAGKHAGNLTRRILSFARKSEGDRGPLQTHLVIKEALKLLRSTIPSPIEICQNIDPHCGTVSADPTQIHQLIMNLCTNAYQSIGEDLGIIEVSLKAVNVDSDLACKHSNLQQGHYIRLTVSDTGHGMDNDTMERIFDPFFTTRKVGKGTGLGLSVTHGIVESHGGAIVVESEPGRGAKFHVYLPQVESDVEEDVKAVDLICRGKESILLVDDEMQVVSIIQEVLEYLGYNVTAKTGSLEALETFRTESDKFDLVITDLNMPGMMGTELAEKLMDIKPSIPVILFTGINERAMNEKAKGIGIREFIMKPT